MNVQEKYQLWLDNVTDEELKKELEQMQADAVKKENAFFKDLEFGTGGLRGILGVGSNCLNVYTIGKITQGIADYMNKKGLKRVAISFDSRIKSHLFAKRTASVFASNGIETFITEELMPTPFLSYITRELKAEIGVMITASHNPAKYNGYKVYGSDGCQITEDAVKEILPCIEEVSEFLVECKDFNDLLQGGKISYVPASLTEDFLNKVLALSNYSLSNLSVTYTPLNGAGYKLVPQALKRAGLVNLNTVKEQSYPDGNFTTCPFPNPEKEEALALGLEYAKSSDSDLLLATDPDCDRVGVAVKHKGEYKLLSGNEVGVLLTDYLFNVQKERGTWPKNPVVVKTIVTTDLVKKLASEYCFEVVEVLTGFKYIGEVISNLEAKGERNRFVLGFEESYGYLSGAHVRDKDGVNGALIISEMTAYYKDQGLTLIDKIEQLYARYGLYEHKLLTYTFEGASGNAEMKRRLALLRSNLPDEIIGVPVANCIDYLTQEKYPLPKANVLSFELSDGCKIIVRPSGTEPLIKCYLTVCFDKAKNAVRLRAYKGFLDKLFAND